MNADPYPQPCLVALPIFCVHVYRGEVACTITTAKPLDAAMAKEVEGALGGFLKKGEKVLITYKVNSLSLP